MWARVIEVMLGCWLAVSPFIFHHARDDTLLWTADWVAAALVAVLACLSYWPPTRRAHLLTIVVALGMVAAGWMQDRPVPPGWQNHILLGLVLLMTAIVPNHAADPPRGWREFAKSDAARSG